jgi:hypothetical protein
MFEKLTNSIVDKNNPDKNYSYFRDKLKLSNNQNIIRVEQNPYKLHNLFEVHIQEDEKELL